MLELTEALLTTEPQEIAKSLTQRSDPTSSQMRKFYDDLVLLQTKVKNQNMDENQFKKEILPLVKFTRAKMAYNVSRGVLPKNFLNQIGPKLDLVGTRADFDHFILFYQALIAYTKFQEFENAEAQKAERGQSSRGGYQTRFGHNTYQGGYRK